MDVTTFRTMMPEFADNVKYPDALINIWIAVSDSMFDADRWGDLLDLGVANWVAHSIILAANVSTHQLTDDVVMKKAGDVQKQRDPMLISKQMEEPLLKTSYGQQFVYYRKLVAMGTGVSV